MKILFDHNVPERLRAHFPLHSITMTRERGWQEIGNATLLRAAAEAEFDAFLTIGKKLEYEQNLRKLPLPVVVIDTLDNNLDYILPFVPAVLELFDRPLERALYIILSSGDVLTLREPRRLSR